MKLPHYSLATFLLLPSLFAQTPPKSIDGIWQGALLFGQGKVRVIFHISPAREGSYSGAMVNLDSGAGTKVDAITFANSKLTLELKSLGLKFQGTLSSSGDEITGKFTEGETSGNLTLTRTTDAQSNAADAYEKHEYMIPDAGRHSSAHHRFFAQIP